MFLPLQADEKRAAFSSFQPGRKTQANLSFFSNRLTKDGDPGQMCEVHPEQSTLCTSKKCRLRDINYCLPECWDKELISVC